MRVVPRFMDQNAAFVEGDRIVIVTAQDKVDPADRHRQFTVHGDIQVGQCDNHIGTGVFQFFDSRFRGFHHGCELDALARRGQNIGFGRKQAKESDGKIAGLDGVQVGHPNGRFSVGAKNIGAQPRKFGFANSFRRDIGAEIELMVSRYGHVDTDRVHDVDHLCAFGQPRHNGRRNQIAAERRDAVIRGGPFLANKGHQLGKAALTTLGRNFIYVVGMKECHLRWCRCHRNH